MYHLFRTVQPESNFCFILYGISFTGILRCKVAFAEVTPHLVSVARGWKRRWKPHFERERKQKRTVLFPIRSDDAVMEAEKAWAAEIRRTRHIGDFRKWKDHDEYQTAFGRLMRDLKAGEKGDG